MNAITDTNPDPAITGSDLNEALRDVAMLADVTIGVWSAERSDRKIMAKVKADADAVGNVGRVIKNTLAGADDKLRDTRAYYAAVRSQHYALTLPWVSDPHADRQRGPRLLPNRLFDRYLTSMSARKKLALNALEAFIDDYPHAVDRARINLKALADVDYPDVAEVRRAFKVSFDFEPVPQGSDFRGLPPAMIGRLAAGLARKQEVMVASATSAMWEKVRERLDHLATRLGQPDAIFKSSTLTNVTELPTLMPAWDVARDPRVTEVSNEIAAMVAGLDADKLRGNPAARTEVSAKAAALARKLESWGV